ncbi:sigma-70 family RNA polymerase sigma factor [Nannocystis sp. ILAH1]|uniref:RNA polymerase sigma factor n=1 Tax=unclassified Nannocystis TaxID=2627009 RepID=UPI00227204F5|nr:MULTISPECIES: sigma-70 family RNA polymerase sigma factor [unclassified Nannocystis]MCY0991998.1 sigma-70 family RNA polymerase sigma factor [Nannocystis sp. ILAH1]MCY1064247.1 sigma-70 family RNA polymerase sigma factor [Nannocystis sp. RBIL2]
MTPRETAHEDEPQLRRFQALYRAEFAFVWSAAQHFGVAAGTVDDVVQEVFLTAYRRLDQLHFEVSPRAWLFGVTRRVAFRHRRGAARLARRHAAFAELARPQAAAPQQRHDDAQLLTRVLGELADGTRTVWEMTELLGMSAPEIASELGLPLNTVYSRLRLARQQLQALVASDRLESLRDATRQRQAPPREAESRTWGVLLPVLGKPAAAVGLTAWVSTQTAAATTMIVAGAATVGLVVAREPARAADRPPTAAHAPVIAAAKEPAGAPEPAPIAEPPVVPVQVPKDMFKRTSSEVASARPQVGTASAAAASDAGARLAAEVAAIDRVQARLAAGDAAGALAGAAEHAQGFPDGTLADVREAARVEALCRLGDEAAALSAAQLLVRTFPSSAVAQRFAKFNRCGQ